MFRNSACMRQAVDLNCCEALEKFANAQQSRTGLGDSGVKTFKKDPPFDSDGTLCLSVHGQAASGVDFVRADTEEHDYIQLTAL